MNHGDVVGTEDDLESQEFLAALLNGQAKETDKVVRLVDLRFRSWGRRERETRAMIRDQGTKMDAILPLVDEIRLVKRIIVVGIPMALSVGMGVAALAEKLGLVPW